MIKFIFIEKKLKMRVLDSGIIFLFIVIIMMIGGLHKIEEGHVGVYYKLGIL